MSPHRGGRCGHGKVEVAREIGHGQVMRRILTFAATAAACAFAASPACARPVADVNVLAGGDSTGQYLRADGKGAAARLYYPAQIAADGDNLLFTEYHPNTLGSIYPLGGAIRTLTPDGDVGTLIRSLAFDGSKRRFNGVVVDGAGLYVTYSHAIVRYDRDTGQMTYLAGDPDQPGNVDGAGDQARLAFPYGMVKVGGKLLIADRGNDQLRALDLATGQLTTWVRDLPRVQSLVVHRGVLYTAGLEGVHAITLARCPTSCTARPVKLPGARSVTVTALTAHGADIYAFGLAGGWKYTPRTGRALQIAAPDPVQRAFGAAWHDGRIYLTDGLFYINTATIKRQRPTVQKPLAAARPGQAPQLTAAAQNAGGLPGKMTYRWKVTAKGCKITGLTTSKPTARCRRATAARARVTVRDIAGDTATSSARVQIPATLPAPPSATPSLKVLSVSAQRCTMRLAVSWPAGADMMRLAPASSSAGRWQAVSSRATVHVPECRRGAQEMVQASFRGPDARTLPVTLNVSVTF